MLSLFSIECFRRPEYWYIRDTGEEIHLYSGKLGAMKFYDFIEEAIQSGNISTKPDYYDILFIYKNKSGRFTMHMQDIWLELLKGLHGLHPDGYFECPDRRNLLFGLSICCARRHFDYVGDLEKYRYDIEKMQFRFALGKGEMAFE